MILYYYFFIYRQKKKIKLQPVKPAAVCLTISLGISLQIGFSRILDIILEITDKTENYSDILSPMMSMTPMMILYLCFLAPLAEEFMFRGLFFGFLKRQLPVIFADMIQAAFFGVYHGNIYQGIYSFIIGMIFGMMNIEYDSLLPSIAAHMTVNITGLFLMEPLIRILDPVLYNILACICLLYSAFISIRVFRSFLCQGSICRYQP